MRHAAHLTPLDDNYETCERTYAELRVYSYEQFLDYLTEILEITPSSIQQKGNIRVSPFGQSNPAPVSGWFLSSEGRVESKDVRRHLDWLLSRLRPAKEVILSLQQRPGVKMTVTCVWWSAHGEGGPTLWPEQMRQLGDLNLELGFEVAFFGDEEE